MSIIETSHLRCRRCHKLLMVETGQEDEHEATIGWTRQVHECWNCGWRIRDEYTRTPVRVLASRSGLTGAQRLRALRDGVLVPLQYDTEPFPVSEFDEEVADASA